MTDEVVRGSDIRSMVVAPLSDGERRLGALGVYSSRPGALGEAEATLVRALADHAAATLVGARLLDELTRSRGELARRAEQERALREITARLAVLREPAEVLQLIVDESRRLLGADDAHLTLLAEGTATTSSRPSSRVTPTTRPASGWRAWSSPSAVASTASRRRSGTVIVTADYLADERIPQEPDDRDVAIRMGLGAMAAAPLRGPPDEVIGTLAISYRVPREVPSG